jgi:hypothetical protein
MVSKKDQKPQPSKNEASKPLASPVCYMDEFPEYFEGKTSDNSAAKDTVKRDVLQSPKP